jgi:hypothetical protein
VIEDFQLNTNQDCLRLIRRRAAFHQAIPIYHMIGMQPLDVGRKK